MSDDIPALWRVDCTPQPRYHESLEAFTERMRGYVREEAAQKRELAVRNRASALVSVMLADGTAGFATRCACRWHGLAQRDAELARREYDAHDCALDKVEIGVSCHRKGEPLGADWATEAKRMLEPVSAPSQRVVEDDSVQRMALLELK